MVLMGKPEGKSPLGRPRRRWEDNIKMDPQKVGCTSQLCSINILMTSLCSIIAPHLEQNYVDVFVLVCLDYVQYV
jgi:hypothetical protein